MPRDLPIEIWDYIVGNLSEPEDVLRFALVNSRMRDIAIPDHLDYTKIWTDNFNASLWLDLNAKRAARVRELRVTCLNTWHRDRYQYIQDTDTDTCQEWVRRAMSHATMDEELTYRIRLDISRDDHDGSTRVLCLDCKTSTGTSVPSWASLMCSALSTMSGLRKLVISSALCDLVRLSSCGFFRRLGRDLDDLEIRIFTCEEAEPSTERDVLAPALQDRLSELHGGYSRFAFHWDYETEELPTRAPNAISNVLDTISCVLRERCPDLRALEIGIGQDYYSTWPGCECRDFLQGRWKDLTSLSLHGVRFWSFQGQPLYEDVVGALAAFLRYHRKVETLRITDTYLPNLDALRRDYIYPALRILHLDRSGMDLLAHVVDSSGLGELRPIESLTIGLERGRDGAGTNAIDCICRHGGHSGSIRKLICDLRLVDKDRNGPWLQSIGQSNLSITELSVNPGDVCDTKEEFLAILHSFPNLEILGISHSDDVTFFGCSKADLLSGLIESLPKLRKVDNWVKQSDEVWVHQVTKETVEIR